MACMALGLNAVPAQSQEIYFNHAFVDVSPATFEAIKSSAFVMNELAGAESHSTVADGGKESWSGLYVYGERTYLEFFPAGGPDDPLGKLGIGLSIDDREQLPQLAERTIAATGVPVPLFTRTKAVGGAEVKWFDAISPDYPKDVSDLHSAWVMALYPDYLRQTNPDLAPAEAGTSREKALARRYIPRRLMRNVTSIALTLPEGERKRLLNQLRGSGYVVTRSGVNDIATGTDSRFILSPALASQPRSVTFHLTLNRDAKPQSLTLGDSTLTINRGATVSWHFRAEGKAAQ